MELNIELLQATQDRIEWDSAHWDQGTFGYSPDQTECKTVMCFAGFATMIGMADQGVHFDPVRQLFADAQGNTVAPESTAARLLGLSEVQAMQLFYNMSENPSDLRAMWQGWVIEELLATAATR